MKKMIVLVLLALCAIGAYPAGAEDAKDREFLDTIERQAFDYFWKETDAGTGLTYNTSEVRAPATNAATGFMLSALVIGVERGWITRDEAYGRSLAALRSFIKMERFHGFTYHYFHIEDGTRMWSSEVSCIDMALFLAGAITAGEYFKGTEVEKLADRIFRETDWQWFLDGENILQMSWKPEGGFAARIDSFSEGIICYILAMGSPTYPIAATCWDAFLRPVGKYGGHELIHVSDGSLFQYLYPLAWLDLRDTHDRYADYWQNAISAVKANKEYCLNNAAAFKTFREGFWGLSASLSPRGYKVFGAKPGRNLTDGTVATDVVAASIPLVPEFAIDDYRSMYRKVPEAIEQYGLTNAFNIDKEWAARHYIAIDKGLMLLMVENYRTGLIWKYFMQSAYVRKGLAAALFKPGSQNVPSKQDSIPGNPHDIVEVKKISSAVSVDADLSEWKGAAPIVLTSRASRNVEVLLGYVRDDADASGEFYLAWDDDYLYIAGRIKDDEMVCGKSGDKIYQDDCVEVFFDVDKNGFYFNRNPNDYQLGLAPTGPGGLPQIWAWGYRNAVPKGVLYAARPVPGGYDIELAIPFAEINNFIPGGGKSVLFSISIHDRDKNGKAKKLTWSVDSMSDPDKIMFGTLVLKER